MILHDRARETAAFVKIDSGNIERRHGRTSNPAAHTAATVRPPPTVDAETAAAVARAVRRTFAQKRGKKPTVLSLLGGPEVQYDESDETT